MAAPVGSSCLAVSSMDLCQLRSCFSISFLSSLLRAESTPSRLHPHVSLEDNDSSSGASVVAIDNKIEQAMDLVKSHLMYAVREEVELLKEQIKELMERNSQLEQENNLLKNLASPEQMAQFQTQVMQSGAVPPQPLPLQQGGGGGLLLQTAAAPAAVVSHSLGASV